MGIATNSKGISKDTINKIEKGHSNESGKIKPTGTWANIKNITKIIYNVNVVIDSKLTDKGKKSHNKNSKTSAASTTPAVPPAEPYQYQSIEHRNKCYPMIRPKEQLVYLSDLLKFEVNIYIF